MRKMYSWLSFRVLGSKKKGFRVQLGGKLGRHPKLAVELEGIYSEDQVIRLVTDCIAYCKKHSNRGERFAEIFDSEEFTINRSILWSYSSLLSVFSAIHPESP